jgi:hypothetical protein
MAESADTFAGAVVYTFASVIVTPAIAFAYEPVVDAVWETVVVVVVFDTETVVPIATVYEADELICVGELNVPIIWYTFTT